MSESLDPTSAARIRSFIERIERLEREKANYLIDIKAVYAEAKSDGYDRKAIRHIIALRKKKTHEIEEEEAVLTLYRAAVGV